MATLEEQIQSIEDEIQRTAYNKATQHHIGKLKAKVARLKDEQETRRLKSGGGGPSYAVKKSGNATLGLVGFPSVGKSTLLNQITDATSAVAAYDFTTLDVIPGLLEHRGAKIQVLDMPGLIRGASKGRGRGKEVLSVARGCDLILLMIDVFETHVDVLVDELRLAGIRLNERPADVTLTRGRRGGLTINPTVRFMRVFLKPQGKEADLADPLIVKADSDVGMVCDAIHRDWRRRFRYANVWGPSAQFPGQKVGLEHPLKDSDVLTVVLRKG